MKMSKEICKAAELGARLGLLLAVLCAGVAPALGLLLDEPAGQNLKVSLVVPELVKLNDPFWLNCSQESRLAGLARHLSRLEAAGEPPRASGLARADIYAIKWYKDDEEFYRFLPMGQPKVSIYETNGIQLDQAKSHEGNVFVSKADINSEGNYRCEILSEAPLFETVRKSKHLRVYALPVRGPKIEILDSSGRPKSPKTQEISYAVGDKIELRCNSSPSKPAARLRWYLNEHELAVPSAGANSTTTSPSSGTPTASTRPARSIALGPAGQTHGYEVRVSPIEHRQHYKDIYSSHSTLSLVLQQDDLINNKISFKCLASMRQEVPMRSKQLIVLTPPSPSSSSLATASAGQSSGPTTFGGPLSRFRAARRAQADGSASANGASLRAQHHHLLHHRQPRPQHQRHSLSRLQSAEQPAQTASQYQQPAASHRLLKSSSSAADRAQFAAAVLSDGRAADRQLWYIYEDSDSTLGASIIDSPESLQIYLRSMGHNATAQLADSGGGANGGAANYAQGASNYALEFDRAENAEYIQALRERLAARQHRAHLGAPTSSPSGPSSANLKRYHGQSTPNKSPLYMDEHDPMRPLINWPPLEAGKLVLMAPGPQLVAIPTSQSYFLGAANQRAGSEVRLVAPSGARWAHSMMLADGAQLDEMAAARSPLRAGSAKSMAMAADGDHADADDEPPARDVMLHQLVQSLNCTCTEGAIDTKLSWLVNDVPLDARDTRYYSTRVTPDHRQPLITVGLIGTNQPRTGDSRMGAGSQAATTLQAILAQYSETTTTTGNSAPAQRSGGSTSARSELASSHANQQQTSANSQIKIACQAAHSLLLYSSSEMITFDFNPPPVDANSLDKIHSSPSNVIQATSASQSSSAESSSPMRSQAAMLYLAAVYCALLVPLAFVGGSVRGPMATVRP